MEQLLGFLAFLARDSARESRAVFRPWNTGVRLLKQTLRRSKQTTNYRCLVTCLQYPMSPDLQPPVRYSSAPGVDTFSKCLQLSKYLENIIVENTTTCDTFQRVLVHTTP